MSIWNSSDRYAIQNTSKLIQTQVNGFLFPGWPPLLEGQKKALFWHFPSHWPASRAISLPYRLECCFWALLWSLAYWHKFYSLKISTKRSPVESNQGILVDSQYPGMCGAEKSDIDWPPGFPNLIPSKFFLSGFLKSKVYTNKPNTI